MPLPLPPRLTGDNNTDISLIQDYLYDIIENFANAVGEAIDPTVGQGGNGALDITSPPSNIVYIPGSELSIDNVIFGSIDITFTKPTRAVSVAVYYKEQSQANFHISYAQSSPFRLPNLKVGTVYNLQLAGVSANGKLGPVSDLVSVTIPTDVLSSSPLFALTDVTESRLLGRGQGNGDGAVEELLVGANLNLTGLTLSAVIPPPTPVVTFQSVKKTSNQVLGAVGDVTQMSFAVESGKYYHIKFLIVASSDIGESGVGLSISNPAAVTVNSRILP